MTEGGVPVPDPAPVHAQSSAGAELRAGREATGLSLEAVAQQLKLAPRQVQALEDDDYASLPGRTFIRGFVRNYARFLGLDPDDVVNLLPGAEPLLERPSITPSGRPMGEMPASTPRRGNFSRWAIPLLLVAIVAAAGIYELRRPQDARVTAGERSSPNDSTRAANAPRGAAGGGPQALPNPFAGGDATGNPGSTGSASPLPGTPGSAEAPAATSGTSPAAESPALPGATDASSPAAAAARSTPAEPSLVLSFKGAAWVQVKDRNGNLLLAHNGQPGTTQSVAGPLPLDVVIGNAGQVVATFRGQPVDLGPYVRGDVARLSLK